MVFHAEILFERSHDFEIDSIIERLNKQVHFETLLPNLHNLERNFCKQKFSEGFGLSILFYVILLNIQILVIMLQFEHRFREI